ncbi:MAG: hypothetical protein ACOXZT_10120 [Tissierellaceae bacterium]|nr:hypothetical protein [Tissierellia bacterium]
MKRTMALILLVIMLITFIIPVVIQALAKSNDYHYVKNVKIETSQVYSCEVSIFMHIHS